MKLINIFMLCFFAILVSCGNVGKVLRNEKVKTTDEFLVKQKDPLILPPEFDKVPAPDTLSKKKIDSEEKFKDILKKQKKTNVKKNNLLQLKSQSLKK